MGNPDEHDWKKLKRVLSFLNCTKNEVRVIGCDGLNNLFTWIDAAYAVHHNMRSHTGGIMSFGWGAIHAKSSKQKLNTKSSTEAEVVGISEYIPYNIWLMNFLGSQGYPIKHNVVYQDNQSAIRMETNGRNSCTGNSRHIDVRYFFVKDRIDKKEMVVEYCPTHEMLADYYTKPLQGALFRKLRSVIMGFQHINILKKHNLQSPVMKERIEERNRKMKVITNDMDAHEEQGNILHEGCHYKNVKNKYENKRIKSPLTNEFSEDKKTNVKNSKHVSFKKE